ncbi:MAG: histidinol-phosphate transaminase [Bacteroidetes bacterium]|nr:histidinol-phosphate transaminase [Bacteroidota bacterium]
MFDIENLVRPNIRALKPYASARDEFSGKEGVFLDANENPFGTLNRYPDPYQKELKKQISLLKEIDEGMIFLGNGSDEIIDLCYRIFCVPGKSKVLSFTPTYGMYEVSAAINEVEMIKLLLNENFQIDLKNAIQFLNDTELKIVFICSPNNPTGNLMQTVTIEFILKNFPGIVIIDEAYIDFANAGSWMKKLSVYPNLIVTQTFSKAWGMAGARVGMAFADKKIVSYLNKVKPPYNISSPNQKQILKKLADKEMTILQLNTLIAERNQLILNLNNIAGIEKIYPSDANFILIRVKDANKVYQQLLDRKIIIRNRNQVIENCLRLSVGKPSENKKLINALKNIL